jgi:2-succinyl-5-enolpyruvyl-6-hydroxy-3-cyclohexene-1-carboxylate synthase
MKATTLARSIIRQLLELGISDFVLSPGSRNAPLSIALYEAEQKGFADLHVRIDERGAAFFALGISKATNNYVAVICTSGTAAANFHPATLEAFHSQSKLVVITADRPKTLRKTGANQTTEQVGLLAPLISIDIHEPIDLSNHLGSGPVHLNVQFQEPLLSDERAEWLAGMHIKPIVPMSIKKENLKVGSQGVLVIGHDRAGFSVEELSRFSQELAWPIIAEDPLSFPSAISHSALALTDAAICSYLKPDEIIVIGRTTLSRSINSFIAECEKVIVIDPRVKSVDSNRSSSQIFTSLPSITSQQDSIWLNKWESFNDLAKKSLYINWSEQDAIKTIISSIPNESALFVGSSRPVRDIEAFVTPREGIVTFANRGLAGIDGNISTAFGIATHFKQSYAILGDLTFLHDVSSLVNAPTVNLTVFIIDNNGGGIFNTLQQSGVEGFEKIFGTPHNLNLEKIITGFGLIVEKVKNAADINHSIIHSPSGLKFVIIEVPARDVNASVLKDVTQSFCKALRIGSNLA